jgi:hypothetical protein
MLDFLVNLDCTIQTLLPFQLESLFVTCRVVCLIRPGNIILNFTKYVTSCLQCLLDLSHVQGPFRHHAGLKVGTGPQ